jgi:hypothetical protein
VQDDGYALPSASQEMLVRSAVRGWRDGLINLTGSNRLLNFRPSRTSMVELARRRLMRSWRSSGQAICVPVAGAEAG